MFLLNSRLGLFTAAAHEAAPLIPKLRGQFAEFLDNPSPVGLRILSSSTCVGLRYGRLRNTHSFSRHGASPTSLLVVRSLTPGSTNARDRLSPCVPVLNSFGGYGISTVCASATPSGLTLAPGLPWADEPAPRNLRLSAITILTQFSLLIPAFSLVCNPRLLPLTLRPAYDAPLPFRQLTMNR